MAVDEQPRAGWRGFGVAGALALPTIQEIARAAEDAGYHTFWVNDTPTGDGLAGLRAAADVTSNIRLGVGVIPLDRQPAELIARRVIELDLPQDRLSLGIGSGGQKGGVERVRNAATALGESLSALVVVGALGPRMCAVAGEASDGVLLNWLVPEYVAPSVAIVEAAAQRAGRPEPLMMGYVRTVFGSASRDVFAREAARYASVPAYAANFSRMGSPAEATGVVGDTPAEIQAGLAAFTPLLDETVVRAIVGEESDAAYLALLEAAAPLA
jgi:alkanesulfonate monooxygenase SsuD/methylene tetrahydromethanopterin reductase-like flavin-dependent oxidoreductase (luciferase family)